MSGQNIAERDYKLPSVENIWVLPQCQEKFGEEFFLSPCVSLNTKFKMLPFYLVCFSVIISFIISANWKLNHVIIN